MNHKLINNSNKIREYIDYFSENKLDNIIKNNFILFKTTIFSKIWLEIYLKYNLIVSKEVNKSEEQIKSQIDKNTFNQTKISFIREII